MKYLDASAILRLLLREKGPTVALQAGDRAVSSQLVEVETFRAIDRARLSGALDDRTTAIKRGELVKLLGLLDLAPIDRRVIDGARSSFGINLRALDAIHVATAELLLRESAGEPLEFWTHDDRQASAAISRGLDVRGLG